MVIGAQGNCRRSDRMPLLQFVFQQNQQVTKFDYDEVGPTVIHKKCC